uniref:Uncharacterized protein n=1 Tax=Sphaerodactylus townsendi TaxID=933632 RepID=A0ACB8EBV1_9SAUR
MPPPKATWAPDVKTTAQCWVRPGQHWTSLWTSQGAGSVRPPLLATMVEWELRGGILYLPGVEANRSVCLILVGGGGCRSLLWPGRPPLFTSPFLDFLQGGSLAVWPPPTATTQQILAPSRKGPHLQWQFHVWQF